MPPHLTSEPRADPPGSASASVDAARARRAALLADISRLERALASPVKDPAWLDRVRSGIERLTRTFNDHVSATEGPAGIYADIRRTAPRLEFAVGRLTREHTDIRESIDGLRALATAADPADAIDSERIRTDGTDLLARLVRHRQRGADLIFEAYEQDIGGGD